MYKRDILETEILLNVWKSSNLYTQMQSCIKINIKMIMILSLDEISRNRNSDMLQQD